METAELRSLTGQLAEDIAWLEQHYRRQPEQANQAGHLRFAAALVRNCIGPFLNGQKSIPLHVAVVGGAGAGKSTVANLLSGSVMAEANPQAGFTRHPIAYASSGGALEWPSHLGFLGPLQKLSKPSPSNVDADVYQVRRVVGEQGVFTLLEHFVVWDCPDMTTWAAENYVSRLLEIAALADVIVYVASDERYNDEMPTQFLNLVLRAGKAVVVCLVKMRPQDAPAFVTHFKQAVLSQIDAGAVACLTIPFLTAAQLADPIRQAAQYRIPLLNQVSVLGEPPDASRKRTVRCATNYLITAQNELLDVARSDLAALDAWRAAVQRGQVEFDTRYRREYLTTERFHRFDQALVRLLELLELPGIGRILSGALYVVRTPYRMMKTLFQKALQRPQTPPIPERPVLEEALSGWLDGLRKETAQRTKTHPVWTYIANGFQSGLTDLAKARFEEGFRAFHLSLGDEVDRTARAIYEELEKKPVALNTLRGTKFALEVAAITGAVMAAGAPTLWDLVLVPLAASVMHQLVELMGKQYVDAQRELARQRQQTLVAQYVSGPLSEYLAQWPSTGGSAYERLQLVLGRIPKSLNQVGEEVTKQIGG